MILVGGAVRRETDQVLVPVPISCARISLVLWVRCSKFSAPFDGLSLRSNAVAVGADHLAFLNFFEKSTLGHVAPEDHRADAELLLSSNVIEVHAARRESVAAVRAWHRFVRCDDLDESSPTSELGLSLSR